MDEREQAGVSDEQLRSVDELFDQVSGQSQRIAEAKLAACKQGCLDAEQFLSSLEKVLLGNPVYRLSVCLTIKRVLVSEELAFEFPGKKPLSEDAIQIITACRDHIDKELRHARETAIPALAQSLEAARDSRDRSMTESPAPAS